MPANPEAIRRRVLAFEFQDLFIQELGWDHAPAAALGIAVGDQVHRLQPIAHKRGFGVFQCVTPDGAIPSYPERRKIELRLSRTNYEHLLIFADKAGTAQRWLWVKREPGQPPKARELRFQKGEPGQKIVQALTTLHVSLQEEEGVTIGHVTAKARKAFDVEAVTKRFYDRFKVEHDAFLGFIKGIKERADQEWYASLMLNRMMFVYFIQKRGFLDHDPDYLPNRLKVVQASAGKDKFQSFYRAFLLRLFHEGLAKPRAEWAGGLHKLLGDVPYLNGGLFDEHELERDNPSIQVPDEAFQKVFDFFDTYSWHLDNRALKNDKEINPDILGYIFEKYINQKEMGAYYTKEDITGYIARNTVIPFLLEAARKKCPVAFGPDGGVWRLLRDDPDKYIYPAVGHGVAWDATATPQPVKLKVGVELPDYIAVGVADVAKRGRWNEPAPATVALPTEIWREVVARRQHYAEVREKLASGQVTDVNDLVTLNLDICRFAQDVIEHSEGPELVRAFWDALRDVTVLDPTCGSGAFLFAALNILEPLYTGCLEAMGGFLDDLERSQRWHHPDTFRDFRQALADVAAHPNPEYFVLKSIVVKNLYGVDIMREAVEICKLRLFLKLVAQLDDPAHMEPLPDIDFNIRSGNTLVGFTTLDAVRKAMTTQPGRPQARMLSNEDRETLEGVEEDAKIANLAFQHFQDMQSEHGVGSAAIRAEKQKVRERLDNLRAQLDRYLAREYGIDTTNARDFQAWQHSHQPFHWLTEFYGTIHEGGFDVIIGNPPYVEVPKDLSRGLLKSVYQVALDAWSRDEDLYAYVLERSLSLASSNSKAGLGMIVPLSLTFSTKAPFRSLREHLSRSGSWWLSHFDRIPSALFGGEVRTRCSIVLQRKSSAFSLSTTELFRWTSDRRPFLFDSVQYFKVPLVGLADGIPKLGSQTQADGLLALLSHKERLAKDLENSISFTSLSKTAPNFPSPCVFVGGTAANWFPAWRDIPESFDAEGNPSLPARTIGFRFKDEPTADAVFALLCSSLGYWWWAIASDGFNLKKWLIERLPCSVSGMQPQARKQLSVLGAELRRALRTHYVYKDNKGRIGNYLLPACEKETKAIDDFLQANMRGLPDGFFADLRGFKQKFSRATFGPESNPAEDDELDSDD